MYKLKLRKKQTLKDPSISFIILSREYQELDLHLKYIGSRFCEVLDDVNNCVEYCIEYVLIYKQLLHVFYHLKNQTELTTTTPTNENRDSLLEINE